MCCVLLHFMAHGQERGHSRDFQSFMTCAAVTGVPQTGFDVPGMSAAIRAAAAIDELLVQEWYQAALAAEQKRQQAGAQQELQQQQQQVHGSCGTGIRWLQEWQRHVQQQQPCRGCSGRFFCCLLAGGGGQVPEG